MTHALQWQSFATTEWVLEPILQDWYRSYGNENLQFDVNELMELRHASINDLPKLITNSFCHYAAGQMNMWV